ncbi:LysM peptidoglycan-binding domain-containing protein [Sphingobacterium hungaricum]
MKRTFLKILTVLFVLVVQKVSAQEIAEESGSGVFQSIILTNVEKQNEIIYNHLDSIKQHAQKEISFDDEDVMIVKRLQRIQKTVPLEYNDQVKAYLEKYVSRNYKPYIEKLLGLSQFYFPIYEKIFAETGLPDEVKYLSVVESSLDPNLVSTSGAVGPWQFMYPTAKIYDLSMNTFVDERKDAYATSYAVSKYLFEAYDEFNDWLLALASYNCGRGCVRRAIARSGINQPTFWQLSPFLPQETRNYIPKFIAMTYVLNHSNEYSLETLNSEMAMDYEVLMVDKPVNLQHVASAINLPLDILKKFNPSYKKNIVNGSVELPQRLLLPHEGSLNDSLVYAALNSPANLPVAFESASIEKTNQYTSSTHKVRNGETLTALADRYGVSVQELRSWNSLTSKSSISGRNLVVRKPENTRLASKPATSAKYITYVVKKGDTLSGIASKYKGATVTKIKSDNNLRNANLRIGTKLKISKS